MQQKSNAQIKIEMKCNLFYGLNTKFSLSFYDKS